VPQPDGRVLSGSNFSTTQFEIGGPVVRPRRVIPGPLGCATRQQLLEMETDFKARMTKMEEGLAAEKARVDELNTRLTAVSATATEATRIGTEATRIGTDAQQRADAAAAKGEAVDGRVTRALANRFSRTQVEEFKVLFDEGRVELSAEAQQALESAVKLLTVPVRTPFLVDVTVDPTFSPAAGGIVGFRISPTFSVEGEITQGARKLTRRIAGQFAYEYSPGTTVSVLGVWKSTAPARVGIAGYTGVTIGNYSSGFVGAGQRGAGGDQSVGMTGGLMFPIRIAGSLSLAPDVRVAFESAGGEPAFSARGGVRVLWGF